MEPCGVWFHYEQSLARHLPFNSLCSVVRVYVILDDGLYTMRIYTHGRVYLTHLSLNEG